MRSPENHTGNNQYRRAHILIDELVSLGARNVYISPGSRSTPLVLAFANHPSTINHTVLDERSAAFMALGSGMYDLKPSVLVCTSGTAVANYLPAVIEAGKSGVPLIVLSADRGFNEHNTGANQWIDQKQLFGNKAVFFSEMAETEALQDESRIRLLARQAWHSSVESKGCAHINIPFRKPLEPEDDFTQKLQYRTEPSPVSRVERIPYQLGNNITELILGSRKPVIVCGPSSQRNPLSKGVQYLASLGIPVIIEAGSTPVGIKSDLLVQGANAVFRHIHQCKRFKPDLIIRFGDDPIGKGIQHFLMENTDVKIIHFQDRPNWANSIFSDEIRVVIPYDISEFTSHRVPAEGQFKAWTDQLQLITVNFLSKRDRIFKEENRFTDGIVHNVVISKSNPDDLVMISNSFPARDSDLFAGDLLAGRNVFMNRGASGIDGITSSALGISLASNRPTTLITGDLAFLHDTNALLYLANNRGLKLRIIVINNNGGSIFRMLPISSKKDVFQRYFETPQNVDIAKIAESYGLVTHRVHTNAELNEAMDKPEYCCVIECVTDSDASMEQRNNLWNSMLEF